MGKEKFKKIPISEFVSKKRLDKIRSIIEKSNDVDTNYDRIENLLDDDFKVIDLGTNRLVLVSKKKKYKDLVFKVAGDSHGIEANYREFYNGDLDKRLTFSYSISKDGVFVVQERVTRMRSEDMKDRKKDVRHMLESLSKKILLVDCKLSNFKNFGIRKNGDVCLLDHGDTVPLPKYQGQDIVNVNEESYVSLRCKKMKDASVKNVKDLEPCGGKLEYDKDFSYLICKRCGQVSSINDAYREFYGDARSTGAVKSTLILQDGFDPVEWREHIREYCINTMGEVADNNKLDNEEGANKMKSTTINGVSCREIKGYFIPEPNAVQRMKYNSMKMGTITPKEYLKYIGVDPDEYKANNIDKENIVVTESKKEYKEMMNGKKIDFKQLSKVQDYILQTTLENGKNMVFKMDELAKVFPGYPLTDEIFMGTIRKNLAGMEETCGVKYFKNDAGEVTELSIRVHSMYYKGHVPKEAIEAAANRVDPVAVVTDEEETVVNVLENNVEARFQNNVVFDDENRIEEDSDDSEAPVESTDTEDDYVRDYARTHNTTVVDDLEEDDGQYPTKTISLTESDVEANKEKFNGKDCVIIKRFYVPVDVLSRYYDEDSSTYEIPKKIKNVLKAANLSPKKYKVGEENAVNSEPTEVPEIFANETPDEEVVEEVTKISAELIMGGLEELKQDAIEDGNVEYKTGYVKVPAGDIAIMLLNLGFKFDDSEKYYTVEGETDDSIQISVDAEQVENIYNLIRDMAVSAGHYKTGDFMADYQNLFIGIYDEEQKEIEPVTEDDDGEDESYIEFLLTYKYDGDDEKVDEVVQELNSILDNNPELSEEEKNLFLDQIAKLNKARFAHTCGEVTPDEVTVTDTNDVNSYNSDDNNIESDNDDSENDPNEKGGLDMQTQIVIDTLEKLIDAVNANTQGQQAIFESNNAILKGIKTIEDMLSPSDAEGIPDGEELSDREETASPRTSEVDGIPFIREGNLCVFDEYNLRDMLIAIRKDDKFVLFDMSKLTSKTFDTMSERYSNVTGLSTNAMK